MHERSPLSNDITLSDSSTFHSDESTSSINRNRQEESSCSKTKWGMVVFIAAALGVSAYFIYNQLTKDTTEPDDPDELVNFMVKSIATIKDLNNKGARIPTSYLTAVNYWLYECSITTCIVDGIVDLQAQTARILASVGQDIYDAAVWQIAMALAGRFTLAYNQNNFLNKGMTADANPESTLRATSNPLKTSNETFTYGATQTYIVDKLKAYFFRMIGPTFFNSDPLAGLLGILKSAGQYWVDWKPISGEVAWAAYIGPLQLAILNHQQAENIPLTELSLQHNMLTAVEAMQSPLGAIYYTTTDVSPNQGSGQVNPYSVSLENNFSMLAGLNMYREILKAHTDETFSDGTSVNNEISTLDNMINKMLIFIKTYAFDSVRGYFYQGGFDSDPSQTSKWIPTAEPFALDVQTWGMTVLGAKLVDEWFGVGTAFAIWQNAKAQAGYYGTNGTTSDPILGVGFSNQPAPITTPTISVTVANENKIGSTLRSFALWEDQSTPTPLNNQPIPYNEKVGMVIPMQSATNSPLKAVQFIDQNNAQVAVININKDTTSINDNADVVVYWNNPAVTFNSYAPRHDVNSAEWTLGAKNMADTLAFQYAEMNQSEYAARLANDSASMKQGVLCLRSDNYFKPECSPQIPASAGVNVPSSQLAYLYANLRYLIPFGWNANPIPSTCATGWAIMAEKDFNPFTLGGGRNATEWFPEKKTNLTNNAHSFWSQSAESSTSTPSSQSSLRRRMRS